MLTLLDDFASRPTRATRGLAETLGAVLALVCHLVAAVEWRGQAAVELIGQSAGDVAKTRFILPGWHLGTPFSFFGGHS